jgi:hypothetical protein
MDAFGGVLFGRALAIGVRRGLFDLLAEDWLTVEEIARALKLSRAGAELLVDAFSVAGYLNCRGKRYRASVDAKKWLVKSSPHYIGNLVRYFETLYPRWEYLEQSLDRGQPPKRYYETFSDDDWKVYVLAMRDLARLLMNEVRKRIVLPVNAKRLLDLGGSHGLYAIDCCRRYQNLKAQIIDFAEALRHTTAIVQEESMEGRITLAPADITKTNLPSDQDCVLLFNVIHGFSPEGNRELINRALAALVPGGKLFILDQIKTGATGSHLSRFIPLMVGLNLLNEIGGNTYTLDDVKSWCRPASSVKHHKLRFPGVSLIEVTR